MCGLFSTPKPPAPSPPPPPPTPPRKTTVKSAATSRGSANKRRLKAGSRKSLRKDLGGLGDSSGLFIS